MRTRSFSLRALLFGAAAAACVLGSARETLATCCPFPCIDCWIESQAQQNLVVMDRANGRIDLIPNIRFIGNAADFALVVPTPALPSLDTAERTIWDEATQLTAPVNPVRGSGSDNFGCSSEQRFATSPEANPATTDGVTIHGRETLGGFVATIVSSDAPGALVAWLNENGFVIAAAESARFEPYVARGWFFTAMTPDTTNRMPAGGWNADVRPVRLRFAAAEFEVPLPLITINQAAQLPLVFYIVDDHRSDLPGFNTTYANRINGSEYAAIERQYAGLSRYVSSGRFLTRLQATAPANSSYDASVTVRRAATDDEFRLTGSRGTFPPIPLGLLTLGTMAALIRARRPRRSR